jgi:DNA-binding LacI/PurR family transcriptional regulator
MKTAVFCFGRMNPPTLGHRRLFDTMKSQSGDLKIFLSKSHNQKEDPLPYQQKIYFINRLFPEYGGYIIEDTNIKTVLHAASYLYEKEYRNVTFVAGSDRIEAFQHLLLQYNGVSRKAHGYYDFSILNVVSSGDREDNSDEISGISATNARNAARTGDFESFVKSIGPSKYNKELFSALRD